MLEKFLVFCGASLGGPIVLAISLTVGIRKETEVLVMVLLGFHPGHEIKVFGLGLRRQVDCGFACRAYRSHRPSSASVLRALRVSAPSSGRNYMYVPSCARFVNTKMTIHMEGKSYDDRIKYLVLWTLEERSNRHDLIKLFKMFKGLSRA